MSHSWFIKLRVNGFPMYVGRYEGMFLLSPLMGDECLFPSMAVAKGFVASLPVGMQGGCEVKYLEQETVKEAVVA